MAKRPVYLPSKSEDFLVETIMVDFEWSPGLAAIHKQKSIDSLHQSIKEKLNYINELLEVSSKSKVDLGVKLSAFNLSIYDVKRQIEFSVEAAFQSSKVFEFGGPYRDLLDVPSLKAKKDSRLKSSGRLIKFQFYNQEWPLEPETAFYDYLYVNALLKHPEYHDELLKFSAFTDIEFNPDKSINCQAYSVALFVSLYQRGLLNQVNLKEKDCFLGLISKFKTSNANNQSSIQPKLI